MRQSVLTDEQAQFLREEKEALADSNSPWPSSICRAKPWTACRKPSCNWTSFS